MKHHDFISPALLALASLFLLSIDTPLVAQTDTFDQRAQRCLRYIASIDVDWENHTRSGYVRDSHSIAEANFQIGRDKEAREIIRRSLAIGWEEYYDPEFPAWAIMDCYLRWKDVPGKYTPQLKEQTKRHFAQEITKPARRGGSRLGTYNQQWMRAVALYLAHQEWPNAGVDCYTKDDPTAVQQIGKFLDDIVHRSHGEVLSNYNLHDLGPIVTLYTFTRDPGMRQKAKMTLDWIVIHHAAFFFNGHVGGSTQRTYYPLTAQGGGAPPDGLYFGERDGRRLQEWGTNYAIIALSDYRPPAIAVDIAWDRKQPFLSRASYISYHKKNRRQSYFNKSYVLFSQYEIGNHMGINSHWHHEALRTGVRWDAPSMQLSTFFLKHPCPKRGDLLGDTWFHQVLQHKTTLLGVFNIPKEKPDSFVEPYHWRRYALAVYPEGYQAIINETSEGRLFLHYGSVMIGLCVTEPFEPKRAVEKTRTREIPYWECRFPCGADGLKMGYVLETALPGDSTGTTPEEQLKAFRDMLARKFDQVVFSENRGRPGMGYASVDGTAMFVEWSNKQIDTVRELDGTPIPDIRDHEQWPLVDNPWIHQDVDGDILTIKHGKQRLVYDFANWAVSSEE